MEFLKPKTSCKTSCFLLNDAMFWRCFWKNIDVNVFDDVLQNTKHRANDASNDVNRPPLPPSWASTALEKSPEMRTRSLEKSCMSRSALYSRMNLTLRQNLLIQSKLLPATVWAPSLQDHQGRLREMSYISAFLYSAFNPTRALE